jgi:hypothetical protein
MTPTDSHVIDLSVFRTDSSLSCGGSLALRCLRERACCTAVADPPLSLVITGLISLQKHSWGRMTMLFCSYVGGLLTATAFEGELLRAWHVLPSLVTRAKSNTGWHSAQP